MGTKDLNILEVYGSQIKVGIVKAILDLKELSSQYNNNVHSILVSLASAILDVGDK